jgi:hypothetical protein
MVLKTTFWTLNWPCNHKTTAKQDSEDGIGEALQLLFRGGSQSGEAA